MVGCWITRPDLAGMAARCALGLLAAAGAQAAPLQVQVLDAAGKPLAGAVVFAESPEARAQLKPTPNAAVVQRGRQFVPQVTVVTVGTPVSFPNEDSVRHHVYSFSATKKFELKLYAGTPAAPVVFDKPGVAVLGCNIHDQMAAWVLVLDTPFHNRSDAAGQAALELPAGDYKLRAWHPELPPGAAAPEQALKLPASGGKATLRLQAGA